MAALSPLVLTVHKFNPRMAVQLACSGLFELALECIARVPNNADAATAEQVS